MISTMYQTISFLLLFLTFGTTVLGAAVNHTHCGIASQYRIVGGSFAYNCEHPWAVSIFMYSNRETGEGYLCGGSIIDNYHILTAAHCMTEKNKEIPAADVIVSTGSSLQDIDGTHRKNGQNYENATKIDRDVASVTRHPYYDDDTLINDIAILKLKEPITYDKCHAPICLPDHIHRPAAGTACLTMGWGAISNRKYGSATDALKYVEVLIKDSNTCADTYGKGQFKGEFCALGRHSDSCEGDSGGPLICVGGDNRYYQFGIVSSGLPDECGQTPGLYTNVKHFMQFIKNHTQ